MQDNCFTTWCWFLPYNNTNQLSVYIHALTLEPPSQLLLHPTPLGPHRALGWTPCVMQHLPISRLFYICRCFNATLSIGPTLSHQKESWALKNWCFSTVVLEKTLESPLDCKEIQPVYPKGNQSWIFIGRTNVEAETPILLATWCKKLTHLKRRWCWERLQVGGEGDNRGWNSWMASLTQWIWVWLNSRNWWWRGRPGMLQSMGLQRVGDDWATELNSPSPTVSTSPFSMSVSLFLPWK